MSYLFFSIVIPAHNEESYISKTLRRVINQNYPENKFEIIVVENGSTDRTFFKIKQIKYNRIKAYSRKKKGISFAKNFGAGRVNKKSDWIIFLDADTRLEKNSLLEINEYLTDFDSGNLVIGTTKLLPIEKNIIYRFWFWFYDLSHKFLKMSASIQIAKKRYFDKVKYDEKLKSSEDVTLIKKMKKLGKFFYIPTKTVSASARRFQKVGGLRLLFEWAYIGILPYNSKIKRGYDVVR